MITRFKIYEETENVTYFDLFEIISDMAYTKDTKHGHIILEDRYSVGIINYLKEAFVGRIIDFIILDRTKGYPEMKGLVEDVSYYIYHPEEIFITVKINGYLYMILDTKPVKIYDWQPGPLFKQLIIEQEVQKYNL
jgi:hypothetical protein